MIKKNNDIIDLQDAPLSWGMRSGGKFQGLLKIRDLVHNLNNYHKLPFRIPTTLATSTCINLKNHGIIDKLPYSEILEKCGGNVAVRSSAFNEDGLKKSHAGEYETILNVKDVYSLHAAAIDVFLSLYDNYDGQNPDKLSMGIIFQEMINYPDIAGVAHSEGFYKEPYINLNYVKNKTAQDLMNNNLQNSFNYKVLRKIMNSENTIFMPWDIEKLKPNQSFFGFSKEFDRSRKTSVPTWHRFPLTNINKTNLLISGFANMLHSQLKHAVDIEYAVKNDTINILQERPYIIPLYKVKKFNDYCISVYNKDDFIIKGEVKIIADKLKSSEYTSPVIVIKESNFIEIQTEKYKYVEYEMDKWALNLGKFYGSNLQNWFSEKYKNIKDKYIDTGSHFSTQKRENLNLNMFRSLLYPNSPLNDIADGDYIELNLKTGGIYIEKRNSGR